MTSGADDAQLANASSVRRRLVQVWGLVADLGFSDLLLLEPGASGWTVIEQVRPTTHQTLYPDDLIGTTVTPTQRPALIDPRLASTYIDANVHGIAHDHPARSRAISLPGGMVLLSEEPLDTGRRRGRLERAYLDIFDQLCTMMQTGRFPYDEEYEPLEGQRVGDGVMVFDERGCIRFASPNATSALHRLGVKLNAEGLTLAELGLRGEWISRVATATHPVTGELSSLRVGASAVGLIDDRAQRSDRSDLDTTTVVATYLIPLIEGSVLLLRDVTDVRRRDRLIVSKDATIREVHHRVKNNLQTISALLRLQGRRLTSPVAKEAIEESVRRIRSMALVHETLSQGVSSSVPFNEVIRPLVRIVEEGLQAADRPVRFQVEGLAGELPAEIATPLAIVLVELLQNAVEHGYPSSAGNEAQSKGHRGTVEVRFTRTEDQLRVTVADDGVGFPSGFSLSTTKSLGLTIVRTLITSELSGMISTTNNNGAIVDLRIPLTKEASP
jgi:two-component system, sensor histidine kinase PdtaS